MPQESNNTKTSAQPARNVPQVLVFDSGVGGLSVLSEIQQQNVGSELIFACDNAAFPYGTLSERELVTRVLSVIERLLDNLAVDAVVIACNSASTLVLDRLREQFAVPFVGVVPAIKPAAALSKTKKIGLLATPGTVARDYTKNLIDNFAADCEVTCVGNADLVTLAEQKLRGESIDTETIKRAIQPFVDCANIDTMVLACTHFPLLLDELKREMPARIRWVDSGAAIARRVTSVIPTTQEKAISDSPIRAIMTADDPTLGAVNPQMHRYNLAPFELLRI